ncbi:dTDP-4-dehydrorhamnose 3,5-epimerase [Atlantibacter hermannii]|uniref:dTDP-4-dehydrorhamnose 3,5-epimerase n=1 Tax=Atlantibacter hermannii TaxID=565 RepID=UPI00254D8479|nr:dTDP-4-dehydrorhamnose 3,5-epimerase [Atlantibacter hermannii]
MKVISTFIKDLLVIEPNVFNDARGFFMESFNHAQFEQALGYKINFVQDNHSCSGKNVLRGLHYQLPPFVQGKLVRCIKGAVFDVAVDIRKQSETYGKWYGIVLSAENKKQLWIPEGFAHGFITLEPNTEFLYKTTNYYNKESERGIIWNDKDLNIEWMLKETPALSDKDELLPNFKNAEVFE